MSQTKAQLLEGKSATIQFTGGSASAPSVSFTGDTNTGIYSPGADQVAISTGGSPRVTVTSTGVGIGSNATSPSQQLHVRTDQAGYTWTRIDNQSSSASAYAGLMLGAFGNSWGIVNGSSAANGNSLAFVIDAGGTNSEKLRIDNSGRLLVGTSSARDKFFNTTYTPQLQLEGVGQQQSMFSLTNSVADNGGPVIALAKQRSGSIGGNTVVNNGDTVGQIDFFGSDGTEMVALAEISASVDGTPGANDMPGRLVFSTTADGASSPTERMRVGANGYLKASNTGSYSVTNLANGSEAIHQIVSNASNLGLLVSARDAGGTAISASVTSTVATGDLYRGYVEASGGIVYKVLSNGNVQNTNNSYGSLSDVKLKENIVDASSQWDDLKALQVRKYNFKEGQTHTQIGLVAQEVELVSPGLVSESPDRDAEGNDLGTVTKSVNYSVLYMKAVKALQEAMERIETLEAKVAALEGV